MLFVFSTCISLCLAWLSVYVIANGFQTTIATATAIQARHRSEYKEHLCGSLEAAAANIFAASELLRSTQAKMSSAYDQAAKTYVASLQSIAVAGYLPWESLSCDDFITPIHHQSPDDTPYDLPNIVYRLDAIQSGLSDE